MPTPNEILVELKKVKYPGFTRDIVSFGMVKDIEIAYKGVTVTLSAPSANAEAAAQIVEDVRRTVAAMPGIPAVDVHMEQAANAPKMAPGSHRRLVPGVRHVLAVASGKGGVGKSTVAVNLALAMRAAGWRIGLMDADVYGPSVAMMVGSDQRVELTPERRIIPLERFGIRYISMALFVNDETAVIWRGPMVTKLETEFLFNVEWGELDCLVLDLPPGTGDAQLTITQRVALAGGIIVTTPQEVALIDARKAATMFEKVNVPVLGLVENMSYFVSPSDNKRYDIFGSGGGEREAKRLRVPLLGQIPIDIATREASDRGQPIVAEDPQSPVAQTFMKITERIRQTLA